MRSLYAILAIASFVAYGACDGYFVPQGLLPADGRLWLSPSTSLGYDFLIFLGFGWLTCIIYTIVGRGRLNIGSVLGTCGMTVVFWCIAPEAISGALGISTAVALGYLFEKVFLKPLNTYAGSAN